MSTHEAARPARHDGEPARLDDDLTADTVRAKEFLGPPAAPLLDPWLAFVSAGVAASAAGYVATSANTFRDVFRSVGAELPLATALVLENASLVPLTLVAAATLLLVLGGVRRATPRLLDVLAGTRLLAVLVAAAGCGCIAANVVVFHELQKSLAR